MNVPNALGFAGVGLVMKFFPVIFPALAGPGFDDSTRGIWLAFMSFVMMGIAGIWFAHRGLIEVRSRWTVATAALAARRAARANAPVSAAGRASLLH